MQRYLRYELQSIRHHVAKHGGFVWHWPQIPEEHLVRSGCLTRHARTKRGYQEYGLDGLALTATGSYVGLQAKCYMSHKRISANRLGSFFHVIARMRHFDVRNSGIVYYCGDLTDELYRDEDILRHGLNIEFEKLDFENPVMPCW